MYVGGHTDCYIIEKGIDTLLTLICIYSYVCGRAGVSETGKCRFSLADFRTINQDNATSHPREKRQLISIFIDCAVGLPLLG